MERKHPQQKLLLFFIFLILTALNLFNYLERVKEEKKVNFLERRIVTEVKEKQFLRDSVFVYSVANSILSDSLATLSLKIKKIKIAQESLEAVSSQFDSLENVNFVLLLTLFARQRKIEKQKITIETLESLLIKGMEIDSQKIDSLIRKKIFIREQG